MFTGIIEATATVIGRTDSVLTLRRPASFDDIQGGSSICIAGVCLTVETCNEEQMTFSVVPETFRKTTLGSLQPGDSVNCERAMRADGRFDGHIVQGHVETAADVTEVKQGETEDMITVALPHDLDPRFIPKGSICIDGVSLTIASIENNCVTVALIPHTLEHTTLGSLAPGDRVNIESDVLGRYVTESMKYKV